MCVTKQFWFSNIKTVPKRVHFISSSAKIPHLLAHWHKWSFAIEYWSSLGTLLSFLFFFFFLIHFFLHISELWLRWFYVKKRPSHKRGVCIFFISDRLGLSATARQKEAFSTECLWSTFWHHSEYHHYKSSCCSSLPITWILYCHPHCSEQYWTSSLWVLNTEWFLKLGICLVKLHLTWKDPFYNQSVWAVK